MRITHCLHRLVQREPDRPLTICGTRTTTVAQSADRVARLAGALKARGLEAGERVGILAMNSDRYHEALFACAWAGLVVVPLNTRWSLAENAFAVDDAGIRLLLADDDFAAAAHELEDRCPTLTTVVHWGEHATPTGWLPYEDLLTDAAPAEDAYRGGSDLFGIFYTGGTTGRAKGVALSHDNVLGNAAGALATYPVATAHGRFLHAAPMFHLADLAAWVMGTLRETTHVMVPAFEPAAVLAALERHRITDTLLVPTMLQLLCDHPDADTADLSSVRTVVYGASPMPEAVLERSMLRFPHAGFVQAYGMTELGPVATLLLPDDHHVAERRRSAGRSTVAVDVRVVDAEDHEVPTGTVGEIVVRGDNVMLGYWNRPEETAQALRGSWMHTGDAGRMDAAGYLFVVDRIKDMIVTGGENVYSVEVEKTLARHPAVAACAVIGVPDPTYGECVHAVVVLHPGSAAVPEELTDFCRAHIANYKVPRSVEFIDALPVSGAGKVLKRELRGARRAGQERAAH
ncbi:long-chain fatty acid--CoA ligase [Streptomyces sp. SID14478]|uniref:acyl-CoA synthetase n=1 Tax=Streptomyces sp. SID14478 TaxID=2706073 RepID=UPI0013DD4D40|nr:long-chain fatty acid--CoA ligase [Streptomyces sp. SID14478]NEB79837.1 long-chain fatty acid--CoA ligase [Streptomyces sp. SID14478]